MPDMIAKMLPSCSCMRAILFARYEKMSTLSVYSLTASAPSSTLSRPRSSSERRSGVVLARWAKKLEEFPAVIMLVLFTWLSAGRSRSALGAPSREAAGRSLPWLKRLAVKDSRLKHKLSLASAKSDDRR